MPSEYAARSCDCRRTRSRSTCRRRSFPSAKRPSHTRMRATTSQICRASQARTWSRSRLGTWKRVVSYYGEPISNAVYKIGDSVFTCYKGINMDFVEEWLNRNHILYLWDTLYRFRITDLEKLRMCASRQFNSVSGHGNYASHRSASTTRRTRRPSNAPLRTSTATSTRAAQATESWCSSSRVP